MILPLSQVTFGLIDKSDRVFLVFMNNKNTKISLKTKEYMFGV
jgi:hypothetical protein